DLSPHMQALTAINPNSVAIPVTRVSGVTTSLALPSGGIFPGTAALINLNGYTSEHMYAGFKGVVMNFPSSARRSSYDRRTDEEIKKETEKSLKQINDIWEKAMVYHKLDSADAELDYYPEMAQMAKVVTGELPLLIEVNAAADIEAAIKWLEGKKVQAALTAVSEGGRWPDKIAKANLPVITAPVLARPTRQSDRYEAAYTNPAKCLKRV